MKRPFLNYFGGKFMLRKWIISNIPKHDVYIEPFGGGASVLLAKDPSRLEIYNDLDSEIVNVFNMAKFHGKSLINELKLTPYSRSVYLQSRNTTKCPLQMAVNTIVKSMMGIGDSIHNKSGFRNSKTSTTSPSVTFRNYVDYFDFFTERLRGVIIESLPYQEIISKYDTSDSFFYFDPPYMHKTRSSNNNYGVELRDSDHLELLEILKSIKGKFLLSGYESEVYDSFGFERIEKVATTQKTNRTEILWMN